MVARGWGGVRVGVGGAACKTCDRKATKSGNCDAGSTADTVVCTCVAGWKGNGVSCSMSKSHNLDVFLDLRKKYFFWATQVKDRRVAFAPPPPPPLGFRAWVSGGLGCIGCVERG